MCKDSQIKYENLWVEVECEYFVHSCNLKLEFIIFFLNMLLNTYTEKRPQKSSC